MFSFLCELFILAVLNVFRQYYWFWHVMLDCVFDWPLIIGLCFEFAKEFFFWIWILIYCLLSLVCYLKQYSVTLKNSLSFRKCSAVYKVIVITEKICTSFLKGNGSPFLPACDCYLLTLCVAKPAQIHCRVTQMFSSSTCHMLTFVQKCLFLIIWVMQLCFAVLLFW